MNTTLSSSKTIIEMIDISKKFIIGDGEIEAVKGAKFTVNSGDIVSIVGTSGSGKSTLLQLIGLLDAPTTGSYAIEGKDVAGLSDSELATLRNKYFGFIFQNFFLIPYKTALENVELPLLYRGAPEVKEQATEILKQVGLGDRLHHLPSQLSGGQRQRVAIARALVGKPRVLLADEPTGNLDVKTRDEIFTTILDLRDEMGLTLIIVTHDTQIGELAKSRFQMSDGVLIRI